MAKPRGSGVAGGKESAKEIVKENLKDNAKDSASGRGSPEAIAKRRVARQLNELLLGGREGAAGLDGRTEKRRRRLLAELEKGTRNAERGLKPSDVLHKVHDLLELGEPIANIRKVAQVRVVQKIDHDAAVALLRELDAAYHFRPEAYRFLGLPQEALVAAGLAENETSRRTRPARSSRSS